MEKTIKILQLAPRFTFPPDDGGKIGIANITKQFKHLGVEVIFFCFNDYSFCDPDLSLIDEFAEPLIYEHSTQNTAFRILKSLFRKQSLYFSKHYNREIIAYLEAVVKSNEFDIIHADHSCMAPIALHLKNKFNIPAGLRLHNIEHLIWQRYADVLPSHSLKRKYIQSQANKIKLDEQSVYPQFDVTFSITEPDRLKASELAPNAHIITSTAGVNIEEWTPVGSVSKIPNQLVLATTYHWRHNVDGVVWFIENVITKLRSKIPDISLQLIGKEAPASLNGYSDLGVNLVGYVDDVKPYLSQASLYISPLFVGGGIRIKILEAMSMKLPVIATTVAAEGIEAGENEGLFRCDNPENYSNVIEMLLDNEDKRKELGENARKCIQTKYSWETNVKIIYYSYCEIINQKLK